MKSLPDGSRDIQTEAAEWLEILGGPVNHAILDALEAWAARSRQRKVAFVVRLCAQEMIRGMAGGTARRGDRLDQEARVVDESIKARQALRVLPA